MLIQDLARVDNTCGFEPDALKRANLILHARGNVLGWLDMLDEKRKELSSLKHDVKPEHNHEGRDEIFAPIEFFYFFFVMEEQPYSQITKWIRLRNLHLLNCF